MASGSSSNLLTDAELKPAEHLWQFVDEPLANKCFDTIEDLDKAVGERCVAPAAEVASAVATGVTSVIDARCLAEPTHSAANLVANGCDQRNLLYGTLEFLRLLYQFAG
jgi:hypothetical protein